MEIEMKYALPDNETADRIWEDEDLNLISDPVSAESVVMKAIYFDTDNGILSANNVAIRVRSEGEMSFATMKWGGKKSEDGLHQREEVNIPVSGETSLMALDPSVFRECPKGPELLEMIGEKPLINLLEMRFLRRRKKIMYKNSVIELALDNGSIITDKGQCPIMEMEMELFAGPEEELKELGAELAAKYSLSPKMSSKFKDGLSILGK